MVTSNTFHCSVITPERTVLDCEASFVAFPAHDGEMGILPNRAPLVCKMGIGVLRVESEGQTQLMCVDGGFAQMLHNQLTLLTEQAGKAGDVEVASAQAALIEAEKLTITDEASFEARANAIRRAKVQLKLAGR